MNLRILTLLIGVGFLATRPTERSFPDESYADYTWESFQQLEAIHQPIDLASPDLSLLNAAVFFVTNRERLERGKPPLTFSPQLRDCADHQARAMARHDFVSHFNPYEARYRTLDRRSSAYGTEAHAENVASNFLHAYRSNTFYTPIPGRPFYQYLDFDDRPIPILTYLQFAESLLDDWMGSAGHRRNILFPELQFLGCAIRLPEGAGRSRDMPLAFCVQNFSY